MTLRLFSTFSGIGGMARAARMVGIQPVGFAEIAPYPSAILAERFPDIPNLGDIRGLTGDTIPDHDIFAAGFPCQDVSLAGRRAGIADGTRSGLWSEVARLLREKRPRFAYLENVAALRSCGLDVVLRDLLALGYHAEWHCIPASHVGAPHQRDRIWITAYTDADQPRLEGWIGEGVRERARQRAAGTLGPLESGAAGGGGWWDAEPPVRRVAAGVPRRVDRLKCLGNTIVPQDAALILDVIAAAEAGQLPMLDVGVT